MKKRIYFPLALAAVALLATGCTAEDPDNGLDISEVIIPDDAVVVPDPTPENPMEHNLLRSYRLGEREFIFDYTATHKPLNVTCYNSSYMQNERQTKFLYIGAQNYPTSMEWSFETWSDRDNGNFRVTEAALQNMEFNGDGLLVSAIYSSQYTDYTSFNPGATTQGAQANVKFDYDTDKHLVKITVNDQIYEQKWADGDLVEIHSPYAPFGRSTITYSAIENRYGQWDPTLPFMGYLQAFGWFGTCPKHFPKAINTAFNPENGQEGDNKDYTLDYYLNYDGLMTQSMWKYSLNESFGVDYDFNYFE